MIQVEGLRKTFDTVVAVDGISFSVRPGEIFGLLGPNGAGKTTTISCCSGLLTPGAGTVKICGRDLLQEGRAVLRGVGVVPQELALYRELSATENLYYWGGVAEVPRAALKRSVPAILEQVGLADRAREPVHRFSGGMLRRLNLAAGLVHDPKVLLLDEPTVGIDPQSRVRVLEIVRARAAAGVSVLYTSHYMEEAEQLCHRFAIIDHGRVLSEGTLDELLAKAGEVIRRESVPEPSLERLFLHLTGREMRE
jgi:ABC-2 type transport system ATP-binding protein